MTLRYIDKRKPTTTARILDLLESTGILPRDNHALGVVPGGKPKGEWISSDARERAAKRLLEARIKREQRDQRARDQRARDNARVLKQTMQKNGGEAA